MENVLWLFAVGVAPFLVGAVIIYALMRRRRLSVEEERARNRKTRELYNDRNDRS